MTKNDIHGGPRRQAELELRRALQKLSKIKRGASNVGRSKQLTERDLYTRRIFRLGEDLVRDAENDAGMRQWLVKKLEEYQAESTGSIFNNTDPDSLLESSRNLESFFLRFK